MTTVRIKAGKMGRTAKPKPTKGVVAQVQAAAVRDPEQAYARADAWARSAPGTPYGSIVPVRLEER
jgi:hypothetical protein